MEIYWNFLHIHVILTILTIDLRKLGRGNFKSLKEGVYRIIVETHDVIRKV